MSPILYRGSGHPTMAGFGRFCGLAIGALALVALLAGMLTLVILTLRLFWRLIVS